MKYAFVSSVYGRVTGHASGAGLMALADHLRSDESVKSFILFNENELLSADPSLRRSDAWVRGETGKIVHNIPAINALMRHVNAEREARGEVGALLFYL